MFTRADQSTLKRLGLSVDEPEEMPDFEPIDFNEWQINGVPFELSPNVEYSPGRMSVISTHAQVWAVSQSFSVLTEEFRLRRSDAEVSVKDIMREFCLKFSVKLVETEHESACVTPYWFVHAHGAKISIHGTEFNEEAAWLDRRTTELSEPRNSNVSWVTSDGRGGMNQFRLPVKQSDKFYPEMYPFIDVDQYFDDFIKSDSTILILNSEPGMGKSRLISEFIRRYRRSTMVVYDQDVMALDQLYLTFLNDDDSDLLVVEDADLLLAGRLEGNNKVMGKILNVADGVISLGKKKFIFTSNLHSSKDIDPALTRPGRCYDILQFRPLSRDEGQIAAAAIGVELESKKEYTVAEIFNGASNANRKLHKIGF